MLKFAVSLLASVLPFAMNLAQAAGAPFYGDPPDARHPWAIHDRNRPQPPRVEPGPMQPCLPPADAIVLFDGTATSLTNWVPEKEGRELKWIVRDGALECVPRTGSICSKAEFGDCRLHIEWAAPKEVVGVSQEPGNSGIFLEGKVEIQVLDNYNNPTYADGFACSIYGVCPPLANALRPSGEFQQVDITFRRPIYKDGKCIDPGYVTAFCNGVLMLNKAQLEGPTGHKTRTKSGPLLERGPLKLQDHRCAVRFRNIWYQPLPSREPETGIQGPLSVEATAAQRKATADTIREDAAQSTNNPLEQMLRYAEALVYYKDEATYQKVEELATHYLAGLKTIPANKLSAQKSKARSVLQVFRYLAKHKIMSSDFGPHKELETLAHAQGWDKDLK
jgi:hypothetical protein